MSEHDDMVKMAGTIAGLREELAVVKGELQHLYTKQEVEKAIHATLDDLYEVCGYKEGSAEYRDIAHALGYFHGTLRKVHDGEPL